MFPRSLVLLAGVAAATTTAGRPTILHHPASTTFVARMNGAQETPANNTKGSGSASITLDGTKMTFKLEVKELSGVPTGAHIHVGAAGVAGGPVYTFALNGSKDGTIAEGSVDLMKDVSAGVSGDSLKVLLSNGKAYVNVHSKNFPGGEIRGQLSKKM